jgi:hypothetical protein
MRDDGEGEFMSRSGMCWAGLVCLALAGCAQQPAVVSPAVVNAPPAPVLPPVPSPDQLGTPAATMSALPDPRKFGPVQLGLTGLGTLTVRGRRYPFNWVEVNSLGYGPQVTPIAGDIYGLRMPEDFAGTYTPIAMSPDGATMLLSNEIGVQLRISGVPSFAGITSLTTRLTR